MNSHQDPSIYSQLGFIFDPSPHLLGTNPFSNSNQVSLYSNPILRPADGKPVGSPCPPEALEENRIKKRLQKTKVCKHFLKGRCHYGGDCTFAHYSGELQVRPNLHKTKLCAKPNCSDPNCAYAHDVEELRLSETPRPDVEQIDQRNTQTVREQKALLEVYAGIKRHVQRHTVTTPLGSESTPAPQAPQASPMPFSTPLSIPSPSNEVTHLQQENDRLRKALDANREALIQLITSNKESSGRDEGQLYPPPTGQNSRVDTPTNPLIDPLLDQTETTSLSPGTTSAVLKDDAMYALIAAALSSVTANSDTL